MEQLSTQAIELLQTHFLEHVKFGFEYLQDIGAKTLVVHLENSLVSLNFIFKRLTHCKLYLFIGCTNSTNCGFLTNATAIN